MKCLFTYAGVVEKSLNLVFVCPVEPHKDFLHVSEIASNLFLTDAVAFVCGEGERRGRGRANMEEIDLI